MAVDAIMAVAPLTNGDMHWASWNRGRAAGAKGEGVLAAGTGRDSERPGRKSARTAILALPSSQILMRVLHVPVTDPDELAAMTELQLDKYTPFPLDQMVISHEVLSQLDGQSVVLAAAARIAVVTEAGKLLSDWLPAARIARVDALLLGRWHTLRDAGQIATDGRETLVLVEDSGIDVLTHDGGVPIGLSGLGDAPETFDPANAGDLAQEIMHLLMGIEAEYGCRDQSMITVWSHDRDVSALIDALQSHVQLPVGQRDLGILPSAISGVAGRSDSDEAHKLDLTPPAWREVELKQHFRRRMMRLAVILVGGWVLLAAGGWGAVAWQRARVARLRAADERWMEPANAVRRLRMQAQLIERYRDRRTSALECLREISLLQPPGVDLSSFTYRKGEGLEIVGEADSGALVIQYNEKLNESALFEMVKAGARTLTPKQRHRFSFEITFRKETP